MSKITRLFIVFTVLIISSCSLTDLDLLDDPNSVTPENAQTDLFFYAIQLDIKDLFMKMLLQQLVLISCGDEHMLISYLI
jgi:hypothetical protein